MSAGLCCQFVEYNFAFGDSSSRIKRKNSNCHASWNCGTSSSRRVTKLVAHASIPSVSGAAGEFSDGLLDGGKRPQRRTVAGVDQHELVDPALLADPDSRFCEFRGVNIHHKICDPNPPAPQLLEDDNVAPYRPNMAQGVNFPMILLHGFGASVYSWNRVMKRLAQITGSKILAFDRPAFGLTSRVSSSYTLPGSKEMKPLNPYSMAFSVLATLYFMDFLASQKAILIGHSAGSLVAVETYFEAPERVAALILVAPAIIAPVFAHGGKKGNQLGTNYHDRIGNEQPESRSGLLSRIAGFLSSFMNKIFQGIVQMVNTMGKMINTFYKKVLAALLRSAFAVMLVRMVIDKFGVAAIRNAWHDPDQVTEHILHGYTKPLRSKDWDRALLEYTAAMFLETNTEKPPLSRRLHEISCPVLIITGDNDRLVPSWNAEKLSQAIPGSSFEFIRNCGHLPHEEKVEEFISLVGKFLQRAFGSAEERQLLQAVS